MLKRLKFYYRYITAPYRLRKWLNLQTLFVLLITAVFFSVLIVTIPPDRDNSRNSEEKIPTQHQLDPRSLSTDMPTRLNISGAVKPAAAVAQETTMTPSTTAKKGPTPTPTLSAEYLNNANQTIGITLMGAILVLIVVVGVLAFLPRHDNIL